MRRREALGGEIMDLLISILVSSAAVFITSRLLRGVTVDGFATAIVVAVILGIINGALGRLLIAFAVPINSMTLGLFSWVIIAGLVMLTSALVPGFQVDNGWWALGFAFILALINSAFHALLGSR